MDFKKYNMNMNMNMNMDMNANSIPEYILIVLFLIYLVLGNNTLPKFIITFMDTNVGKTITVIIALALFAYTNPVLGVLGLLVCYKLFYSSSNNNSSSSSRSNHSKTTTSSNHLDNIKYPYTNSFKNCGKDNYNKEKERITLEQEMVSKMTHSNYNTEYQKTAWKPQLEETYNASQYSTAFSPIAVVPIKN